jgi:hypothetical protein
MCCRKFMQYCPERKLRWNAYTASVSRGSRDSDVYLNASGHVKVRNLAQIKSSVFNLLT